MSLVGRVMRPVFHRVNRTKQWYQLGRLGQVANLVVLREDLRTHNLHDTKDASSCRPVTDLPKHRTYDGSHYAPGDANMGARGTRFGRNAPLSMTVPEPMPGRLEPNPREVSRRLLTRDTFKPATTLNVIAAAWIQFENHGWFSHGPNPTSDPYEIPVAEGDDWPERPMRIRRTQPDPTPSNGNGSAPTYVSTVPHWWDGSQVYGPFESRCRRLRTGEDGRMILENGRLQNEDDPRLDGIDLTGFNDNYWVGQSLLHTLFTREHNAICDHLRKAYPSWDDERLFLTARLVNAALMAKIHTVEWTPGILAHPALKTAMYANWYGVLPNWVRERFGRLGSGEILSGIPGSPTAHHAAPFSITEEFIAVYRLHPLIPDDYEIRSHTNGELIDTTEFTPIQGKGTRPSVDRWGMSNLWYSLGTANPGAVTLHNHPRALQNLERVDGERVDLGTIDIFRDRERGVPRYNDFLQMLRKPLVNRFEELSDNPVWVKEMREVYENRIDRVDLMVGMYSETPPPGFGFSDTAFRIFILMASRRLKSDRFFTTDFRPEVYTPEGMEWVNRNGMIDVLLRHHPELAPALQGVTNAFAPWRRLH
jgi:hypothetical protein